MIMTSTTSSETAQVDVGPGSSPPAELGMVVDESPADETGGPVDDTKPIVDPVTQEDIDGSLGEPIDIDGNLAEPIDTDRTVDPIVATAPNDEADSDDVEPPSISADEEPVVEPEPKHEPEAEPEPIVARDPVMTPMPTPDPIVGHDPVISPVPGPETVVTRGPVIMPMPAPETETPTVDDGAEVIEADAPGAVEVSV